MFTRHQVGVTAPLAWVVLFTAASVTQAQGPDSITAGSPNSIYSALEIAPKAPTSVHPQLQQASAIGYGLASLDPETQGDLFMIHQRYLAAVEAYKRADHDSPVVWNKIGIAYQHMYALDFAKMQYEKALSMDPKYAEALNNLGTVYYGMKNYHKAENYYRKAIRYKPETASFFSNLGTAYFSDHKYKQGVVAYQRAFALDPDVFIRESLERIAEMGPVEEQANLNFTLAKLYAQAGNMKAALIYLRAALNEGFDNRKKIMGDKDLANLRETPEFHLLLAEEHLNN